MRDEFSFDSFVFRLVSGFRHWIGTFHSTSKLEEVFLFDESAIKLTVPYIFKWTNKQRLTVSGVKLMANTRGRSC